MVFAAWYLAFGRHGAGAGFASPAEVLRFAARGLTNAVARVAGFDLAGRLPVLGWLAGAAAVLLVVAILVRQALGRLVAPLALGGAIAAVAMYLVIGLTRADLPSDFATRSRYVYVAGIPADTRIRRPDRLVLARSPGAQGGRRRVARLGGPVDRRECPGPEGRSHAVHQRCGLDPGVPHGPRRTPRGDMAGGGPATRMARRGPTRRSCRRATDRLCRTRSCRRTSCRRARRN